MKTFLFRAGRCHSLLLAAAALLLAARPAAADEVPFITSPDNVTLEMLRISGVRQNDYVLDLGSGDGRIVILAAKRFKARGLGVEIDPSLVVRSNDNARAAGVSDRAEFREQDLFKTDLSVASVITMYLLPEVNLQLRPALLALKPGTRVVSHDWDLAEWKPDRSTVLPVPDKKVGREKSSTVHLWIVPAALDGLWCGQGALRGASLRVAQKFQFADASLRVGDRSQSWSGRITGPALRLVGDGTHTLALQAQGDTLRVAAANSDPALRSGQTFQRASLGAATCG